MLKGYQIKLINEDGIMLVKTQSKRKVFWSLKCVSLWKKKLSPL